MKGSYFDDWEKHKSDITWRKFWVLIELYGKWKWADKFYKKLDRGLIDNEIVAPEHWSLFGGEGFMNLCLWISIIRSVHEGLTENLDSYDTSKTDKMHPSKIFTNLPPEIKTFPIDVKAVKDFRNVIFHCQWSPTLPKLKLKQQTVNDLDKLHQNIGEWLDKEFTQIVIDFKSEYEVPQPWIIDAFDKEFLFP